MATKPETQFRKRVRADLLSLERVYRRFFFDPIQQKSIKGSADFYLCLRGHFIALELKDVSGIVSDIQKAKHKKIDKALGTVKVADQTSWPKILSEMVGILEDGEKNDNSTTH